MNITTILFIIRWPNLLMIAMIQYFCRHFLLGTVIKANELDFFISELNFFLLVLSTILISAAGYIINDYFDIEADSFNGKAAKANFIKKYKARFLRSYYLLCAIGILLGLYLAHASGNLNLVFVHLIAVALLWFYSVSYKKNVLIGNIVIAFLSSLTLIIVFIFEFFAFKNSSFKINFNSCFIDILIGYSIFAFVFSLLREIVKDIEDIEGDKKAFFQTLPVKLGVKRSKIFVLVLLLPVYYFLINSEIWLYKYEFNELFYFFIGPINLLLIAFTLIFIYAKDKKRIKKSQLVLKLLMFAGVVSMIFVAQHADKLTI